VTGQPKHDGKRRLGSPPVLLDEFGTAASEDRAKYQRDEDGVIELSGYRNEVGDEVEGQGEVADERAEQELVTAPDAGVAHEPTKEHDAIGDEPGKRARGRAPSEQQQREYEQPVGGKDCGTSEQEPPRRAHGRNTARPSVMARTMPDKASARIDIR